MLLQLSGRHDGAIDSLCLIEEQRRAAAQAAEDAKQDIEQLPSIQAALAAAPDEIPKSPSVAALADEITKTLPKPPLAELSAAVTKAQSRQSKE